MPTGVSRPSCRAVMFSSETNEETCLDFQLTKLMWIIINGRAAHYVNLSINWVKNYQENVK